MPIFEYRCLDCGKTFEELVISTANADDVECEYCGSKNVRKLVSGFSTISNNSSTSYSSSSSSCTTSS